MANDKDGSIKVEIYSDEMSAIVFIMPPDANGRAIDVMDVKNALKEAGVVYGIVSADKLETFVNEGKVSMVDFQAASGDVPGHGEDARMIFSWQEEPEKARDAEADKIDLRELNIVKSVRRGDIIARKVNPTRGKEGITVTGRKTPGEWGTDLSIRVGMNIKVSENETEFVAGIDGSPKFAGGVLSIDPVYVVKGNVDFSTGNIAFSGALEIKGGVLDGFEVKADGNITIWQNVQACRIVSGGDVIVKGGIINRHEGIVAARGSVYAKFIENSIIEAEENIVVDRAIINSELRSNSMVVCSSREGRIMGGDIMAYREIRAKNLGTENETGTTLRVGYKFDVYLALAEMEKELEEVTVRIGRDQKSISGAKMGQSELVAELRKNVESLENRKNTLIKQIAAQKFKVQVNPFATVKGEEFIHPGCVIYVGSAKERVSKPMRFATLSCDKEGGIALSSYDEKTGKVRTTNVGAAEKKTTVLIVDDAKFMRAKLKNILENGGFRVAGEAEDGMVAMQLYAKLKPDVVTMDITMPNVDGIAALKAIKKSDPDAKIVMISALGQKEKVKEAIISGAQDFILKPFVPDKVIEILTRITKKQG